MWKIWNFCPKDTSCLNWLDDKKPRSVIYVAFGSNGVDHKNQFEEQACPRTIKRLFLWAFGAHFENRESAIFPEVFLERVVDT